VAFKGTVRGAVIELDEPLALPEGTRVHLEIVGIGDPPLPKGSPQLVLQLLAGTLATVSGIQGLYTTRRNTPIAAGKASRAAYPLQRKQGDDDAKQEAFGTFQWAMRAVAPCLFR
jgi:hypothetical protein